MFTRKSPKCCYHYEAPISKTCVEPPVHKIWGYDLCTFHAHEMLNAIPSKYLKDGPNNDALNKLDLSVINTGEFPDD